MIAWWWGTSRSMRVGYKLFGRLIARRREPGFLGALDLGYPSIMDDELNDPVAESFHFFANNGDPIGRIHRRGRMGM